MSESKFLKKLNVGCGSRPIDGYVNLDIVAGPKVDVVFNLEKCGDLREYDNKLPFPDDTFDRILCRHTAEHIRNFLPMMEELHRVAKPGAEAAFVTPYGGHDIAFEDPTHIRQFFPKSWLYVSQTAYGGADYGYRGDWDTKQIILRCRRSVVPVEIQSDSESILEAIMRFRNICEEMTAILVAVKPIRLKGTGEWNPDTSIQLT